MLQRNCQRGLNIPCSLVGPMGLALRRLGHFFTIESNGNVHRSPGKPTRFNIGYERFLAYVLAFGPGYH